LSSRAYAINDAGLGERADEGAALADEADPGAAGIVVPLDEYATGVAAAGLEPDDQVPDDAAGVPFPDDEAPDDAGVVELPDEEAPDDAVVVELPDEEAPDDAVVVQLLDGKAATGAAGAARRAVEVKDGAGAGMLSREVVQVNAPRAAAGEPVGLGDALLGTAGEPIVSSGASAVRVDHAVNPPRDADVRVRMMLSA
jgi:hypothetical protein